MMDFQVALHLSLLYNTTAEVDIEGNCVYVGWDNRRYYNRVQTSQFSEMTENVYVMETCMYYFFGVTKCEMG